MTKNEATFSKIKICEAILQKCEGYGTNESLITMAVFKEIIREVLKEGESEFLIQEEYKL